MTDILVVGLYRKAGVMRSKMHSVRWRERLNTLLRLASPLAFDVSAIAGVIALGIYRLNSCRTHQ